MSDASEELEEFLREHATDSDVVESCAKHVLTISALVCTQERIKKTDVLLKGHRDGMSFGLAYLQEVDDE